GGARSAHEARVPLLRRMYADLDTPVSAYLKLVGGATDQGCSFLLESVHGGEHPARYSFLGATPSSVLRVLRGAGNPFVTLAAQAKAWRVVQAESRPEALPPVVGGA